MKKQKGLPSEASAEAGQTLIEILLALSVAILVLGAILVAITTSLNNTQYTKNQGLANTYAQEGMSIIRQIRDASWNNFSNLKEYIDTTYCIDENSIELRNPAPELNCGQNVGIFRREVNFEHDSSDCIGGSENGSRVTVKVSWSDNKCGVGGIFCHSVELISCFSNIDQKQTP